MEIQNYPTELTIVPGEQLFTLDYINENFDKIVEIYGDFIIVILRYKNINKVDRISISIIKHGLFHKFLKEIVISDTVKILTCALPYGGDDILTLANSIEMNDTHFDIYQKLKSIKLMIEFGCASDSKIASFMESILITMKKISNNFYAALEYISYTVCDGNNLLEHYKKINESLPKINIMSEEFMKVFIQVLELLSADENLKKFVGPLTNESLLTPGMAVSLIPFNEYNSSLISFQSDFISLALYEHQLMNGNQVIIEFDYEQVIFERKVQMIELPQQSVIPYIQYAKITIESERYNYIKTYIGDYFNGILEHIYICGSAVAAAMFYNYQYTNYNDYIDIYYPAKATIPDDIEKYRSIVKLSNKITFDGNTISSAIASVNLNIVPNEIGEVTVIIDSPTIGVTDLYDHIKKSNANATMEKNDYGEHIINDMTDINFRQIRIINVTPDEFIKNAPIGADSGLYKNGEFILPYKFMCELNSDHFWVSKGSLFTNLQNVRGDHMEYLIKKMQRHLWESNDPIFEKTRKLISTLPPASCGIGSFNAFNIQKERDLINKGHTF